MRMLKFNMSLILSLAFFVAAVIPQGVQASTSSEKMIANAFDRFHYALSVEWDQKDETFLKVSQKELEDALLDLKESGLSNDDIQNYMMKSMLSKSTQKEYAQMMSAMKKQNFSEKEAMEVAVNFMDKKYQEGSNFLGKGGGWDHPGKHKWIICAILVIVVVKICFSKGGRNDSDNDEYNEYNYYY